MVLFTGVSGQLLAQGVGGLTATVVYTAPIDTEITRIVVANTTGAMATFRLFLDRSGSASFTAANALAWDFNVGANDRFVDVSDPGSGYVVETGGRIAFRASAASTLTFSMFGFTDNIHGVGGFIPGRS